MRVIFDVLLAVALKTLTAGAVAEFKLGIRFVGATADRALVAVFEAVTGLLPARAASEAGDGFALLFRQDPGFWNPADEDEV